MAKLPYSKRLFAGQLLYFSEFDDGVSDIETLPLVDAASWLEIGCVSVCKHMPQTFEQPYSCPDATRGWIDRKDVFTLADIFEITTEEVSELYHRLAMGVAAPLVAGTGQVPFTVSDRKVTGWIKAQKREHTGDDRDFAYMYVEIRLKEDPATEKKVQVPVFEIFVLHSALNDYELPA